MSKGAPDIARIISLIMENPKLIEEISRMAQGDGDGDTTVSVAPNKSEAEYSVKPSESTDAVETSAPPKEKVTPRRNRGELLCALKPYVSRERAQAIDSMLSIVEILDVMKGGK